MFVMETSRTADAAKLAILWRDRDKQQSGGGSGGHGVPDHFVEDAFEGGILPEVIPPPPGPPTTNPDGTITPGEVPEPTLVDHKTVYTDAGPDKLQSLFAAVQELRRLIASPEHTEPTDPLYPLTAPSADDGAPSSSIPYYGDGIRSTLADLRAVTHGRGLVFGSGGGMQDRVEALRSARTSILDILLDLRTFVLGFPGPEMTQRIPDWLESSGLENDLPGVGGGVLRLMEHLTRRLNFLEPDVETAKRDLVYAEERIRALEDSYVSLSQRVGALESGTSGQ